MPSPFTGMNPYIEQAGVWNGFHHRFMTYAAEDLTMAAVDAIEVADGDGAGTEIGRDFREAAVDLHAAATPPT